MKKVACMFLLLLSSHSYAAFQSGNSLYKAMQTAGAFSNGHAHGYIIGVADSFNGIKQEGGDFFCIPKGATEGQLVDVVRAWIVNNPQQRHFSALSLISRALDDVFPCKKP